MNKLFIILFFAVSVLLPSTLFAATLSLDPVEGSFGPGDMFVVTVRVDTDKDECINAADVAVAFPKDLVKVSAVSKGESLMTLWTDGPLIENEKGSVSWSGGIPGGYCGRVLGDPGKTNILGHRHGIEQSRALKEHPEFSANAQQFALIHRQDVFPVDQHLPFIRLEESD